MARHGQHGAVRSPFDLFNGHTAVHHQRLVIGLLYVLIDHCIIRLDSNIECAREGGKKEKKASAERETGRGGVGGVKGSCRGRRGKENGERKCKIINVPPHASVGSGPRLGRYTKKGRQARGDPVCIRIHCFRGLRLSENFVRMLKKLEIFVSACLGARVPFDGNDIERRA